MHFIGIKHFTLEINFTAGNSRAISSLHLQLLKHCETHGLAHTYIHKHSHSLARLHVRSGFHTCATISDKRIRSFHFTEKWSSFVTLSATKSEEKGK